MTPFHKDIIKLTKENTDYRRVVATAEFSQVVLMSIPPQGDIGEEVHDLDQVLIFVQGSGISRLNDKESPIEPNHLVLVPAGTKHNFINTGSNDLKLFTIYAPPEHKPGIVRVTKEEAEKIPE